MILTARHRRCHTVFLPRRGQDTPHLNAHYPLSYASDKFIKNTIWKGLSFVLYFQSSSFLPVPLEFLSQFVSLCLQTILPKSSILHLSLSGFPLPSFSYKPITRACTMSKRQRGTAWAQITFPLHAHSNSTQTNLICCC